MNYLILDFYQKILIELVNTLELDSTRILVIKKMNEIKQDFLNKTIDYGQNPKDYEQLFNYTLKDNLITLKANSFINIPKKVRKEFEGFKDGVVICYYNPQEIKLIKNNRLDVMKEKIIEYKKYCPTIDIKKYLELIDIEKKYNEQIQKEQCEYMMIACCAYGVTEVFDIYGKKINLSEKISKNHICLINQELIDAIKLANPKTFEFNSNDTKQLIYKK